MLRFIMGVVAISLLLWAGTPYAHGQKTTEMFIPIGQSPGQSGSVTIVGTIETVNTRNRTIVVAGPSGQWNAQVTRQTHIWLDRSTLGLSNQYGKFADLRRGRLVEVKYVGSERRSEGPAEWIKVQVTTPSAKLDDTRQ
ncbi:MAG: hypothetical protein ACE5MG_03095 [Candidatus Methylomirabilales bacterium]